MRKLVHNATAALRHYANQDATDPVAKADRYTSMCDARTAIGAASGTALDDIDPTTGYSHSRRAYDACRHSWVSHIKFHGLSEYTRPGLNQARASWAFHRPAFIEGDDWEAEGAKLHRAQRLSYGPCGESCELCPITKEN